jgi:hypothetical protein
MESRLQTMTLRLYLFTWEDIIQSSFALFRLSYFQSDIKWQFVGFHASKCLHFERLPPAPRSVRQRNHSRAPHGTWRSSLYCTTHKSSIINQLYGAMCFLRSWQSFNWWNIFLFLWAMNNYVFIRAPPLVFFSLGKIDPVQILTAIF